MVEFETTVQAFETARTRSSIAQHAEARLLHLAVYDAREAGLSVRETAAALRVPKSTVARHWRGGETVAPPAWGNPEEYLSAERAIWAHAPDNFDNRVPYEWEDHPDGTRSSRAIPLGVITAR